MNIEFDPAKDAANPAKHGISLRRADIVAFEEDRRFAYGETRYRAFGLLEARLIASSSHCEAQSCVS
jgi:uncharacterized protein